MPRWPGVLCAPVLLSGLVVVSTPSAHAGPELCPVNRYLARYYPIRATRAVKCLTSVGRSRPRTQRRCHQTRAALCAARQHVDLYLPRHQIRWNYPRRRPRGDADATGPQPRSQPVQPHAVSAHGRQGTADIMALTTGTAPAPSRLRFLAPQHASTAIKLDAHNDSSCQQPQ
jgi:hypothetical protein